MGHLSLEEYSKNQTFRGNPRALTVNPRPEYNCNCFQFTKIYFSGLLTFIVNKSKKTGMVQMSADEYAWQRIITDEARKIFFAMDNNKDRRVSKSEFIDYRNIVSKDMVIQTCKF